MEPTDLLPAAAAEIRLLAAAGIDGSYMAFVARHLDATGDSWRWCCGSRCDPCVRSLAGVVDAVRVAGLPGLPGPPRATPPPSAPGGMPTIDPLP
jgi:hypothetical protein